MAFMALLSPCGACGTPMSCNPDLVPALRIGGEKRPICIVCVHRWNELHPDDPPFIPHADAYEAQEVT